MIIKGIEEICDVIREEYQYGVKLGRFENLKEATAWCAERYGFSNTVSIYVNETKSMNDSISYVQWGMMFYFKDLVDATFFKLRWG